MCQNIEFMNMQRDAPCVQLCERRVYQLVSQSSTLFSYKALKLIWILLWHQKAHESNCVTKGQERRLIWETLYNCIAFKERAGKQANALFVENVIMTFLFKLKQIWYNTKQSVYLMVFLNRNNNVCFSLHVQCIGLKIVFSFFTFRQIIK